MTKLSTKFGEPRPKHSLVIDQKPFGLWTDRQTIAKTIYPLFIEEGIKRKMLPYFFPKTLFDHD